MTSSERIVPYISSVVSIGQVPLGGNNPIRLQSMTNTDTLDTKASVGQCIRIIEAGADYVRLTAQGIREATNLKEIKAGLRKAGFETPLIADIHFNPEAAEAAARIVEKVRINPGNYTDKRASFQVAEFTEKEYGEELERIHSRLLPLIKICQENNTVIRLGINHGSLSDRIMTRYGNTPEGMVQSAFEFIDIFRGENFQNLVLSMKSSDTAIMIMAVRMLVNRMQESGMSYPLHLGVTEAGEGEDGRIRSAAGIGALLADGIGDTIRVSLSEDPEKEIPVAKKLTDFFPRGISCQAPATTYKVKWPKPAVFKVKGPLVISNLTSLKEIRQEIYTDAGFRKDEKGKIIKTDNSSDLVIIRNAPEEIPQNVNLALPYKMWYTIMEKQNVFPLFSPETFRESGLKSDTLNVLLTGSHFNSEYLNNLPPDKTLVIFTFYPDKELYAPRLFMKALEENDLKLNIILNPVFHEDNLEDLQVKAAALLGKYMIDEQASGILLSNTGAVQLNELNVISFSILNCTGLRITRTIYLSCPTCGRTKFNLQETVKKVKAATGHYKGLKIAVMGCIVNGPGEMAGADYGYVGAAPGKVHIYKGTVAVLKNVPEDEAISKLLEVISRDR